MSGRAGPGGGRSGAGGGVGAAAGGSDGRAPRARLGDLGLEQFSVSELFSSILVPGFFLLACILQLHCFHRPFMRLTDLERVPPPGRRLPRWAHRCAAPLGADGAPGARWGPGACRMPPCLGPEEGRGGREEGQWVRTCDQRIGGQNMAGARAGLPSPGTHHPSPLGGTGGARGDERGIWGRK